MFQQQGSQPLRSHLSSLLRNYNLRASGDPVLDPALGSLLAEIAYYNDTAAHKLQARQLKQAMEFLKVAETKLDHCSNTSRFSLGSEYVLAVFINQACLNQQILCCERAWDYLECIVEAADAKIDAGGAAVDGQNGKYSWGDLQWELFIVMCYGWFGGVSSQTGRLDLAIRYATKSIKVLKQICLKIVSGEMQSDVAQKVSQANHNSMLLYCLSIKQRQHISAPTLGNMMEQTFNLLKFTSSQSVSPSDPFYNFSLSDVTEIKPVSVQQIKLIASPHSLPPQTIILKIVLYFSCTFCCLSTYHRMGNNMGNSQKSKLNKKTEMHRLSQFYQLKAIQVWARARQGRSRYLDQLLGAYNLHYDRKLARNKQANSLEKNELRLGKHRGKPMSKNMGQSGLRNAGKSQHQGSEGRLGGYGQKLPWNVENKPKPNSSSRGSKDKGNKNSDSRAKRRSPMVKSSSRQKSNQTESLKTEQKAKPSSSLRHPQSVYGFGYPRIQRQIQPKTATAREHSGKQSSKGRASKKKGLISSIKKQRLHTESYDDYLLHGQTKQTKKPQRYLSPKPKPKLKSSYQKLRISNVQMINSGKPGARQARTPR